jgi:antitoxin ParD1/3/4
VRELIRKDRLELRNLLLAGAASAHAAPADTDYFKGLRERPHPPTTDANSSAREL